MKESLDRQLWHACAGGMVQMPPVYSKVFYFPQGHAEHTSAAVDFSAAPRIPPLVPCRVAAVEYLADSETDEVYSKIRLVPLGADQVEYEDDDGVTAPENTEKPSSFAKTLTQSDANNGGGFSVPRYCAETIFPRLDYAADPPVQTVIAKDVHGEVWKFRHIYRGTPRRHLLTTGWSAFVNQKKLVAGDLIVFLRADNGELRVGIRRAKRGINGGGAETPSGWSSGSAKYPSYGGGLRVFLREDESKLMRNPCGGSLSLSSNGGFTGKGRIRPESVIEAASLAANGQPFEVVYYPRASTPEFCVKASAVRSAMRSQWCSGMRFKMAFETEDSSRISWFMGTVASVQVADHIRWPNSPWGLLQVTWDEPDLLQNVKRVSPWLVELVSNMPIINLSPFSPSRKKLCLPQLLDSGQFSIPSFSGNPLWPSRTSCCPAGGIQGARQTLFGRSLPDLHFNNKLHFRSTLQFDFDHHKTSDGNQTSSNETVSCLLTMGSSSPDSEKRGSVKKHRFLLFGQPILTEQEISSSPSSDTVSQVKSELGVETGHCKVFMESEDLGRTLDLSALGSYEELYQSLTSMFGLEKSEVMYMDVTGAVRKAGDEPFSDFVKSARRLTVLMDSGRSKIERTWITGMRNGDNGLDSTNKRGPLSIFG